MTNPAEIPDASDEVTTNNLSSDAARHLREDRDVVQKVMMTPRGRAWLYRKLDACFIYQSAFVPGEADTTAFNLGQQEVGKRLLDEATKASPDLYITMIREARDEADRVRKVVADRNERRDSENTDYSYEQPLPPPEGFK